MDSDFEDEKSQKKQRKPSGPRKLMRWDPDKDQLVLLVVDHVCIKLGIQIPWHEVAKEISPDLSGEAIKQHLAKVTKHREHFGLKVPGKLAKGARRKAGKAAGDPTTPMKTAKGKKVKDEDADDGDGDETSAYRSTLLWHQPEKKTKTQKTDDAATVNAPASVRGGTARKKATKVNADEEGLDKLPKSTGKRGRNNGGRKTAKKDEDEGGSPTKKPKIFSLRPKEDFNYNEQYDSDDDVYDARQGGDDDDDWYEETEDTQPKLAVKGTFDSYHGTSMNTMPPPPPFASPAQVGLQHGFPQAAYPSYINNHAQNRFVSSPNTQVNSNMGQQTQGQNNELSSYTNNMSRNGVQTMGFGNFHGIGRLPPSMSGNYVGGGEYTPFVSNNFDRGLDDPFREQDLRQAIDKKLASVPEGNATDTPVKQRKTKSKTPRKNAAPKENRSTSVAIPKQVGYGDNLGNMVSKVESETLNLGGDIYNDHSNTGMISIGNDNSNTYSHPNNFEFGSTSYDMIGSADMLSSEHATPTMTSPLGFVGSQFNTNTQNNGMLPALNTQFHHGQATLMMASPDEYGGGYFDFNGAHTSIVPAINNSTFESSTTNNLQLTQSSSNTSSFTSIQASQSSEAVPSLEQGGLMNFDAEAWDPSAYEEQMAVDQYANLGFNFGDLDGSYFN